MMFHPEPLPKGLNEEEQEEIREIRANGRKDLREIIIREMDFSKKYLDLTERQERGMFIDFNMVFQKERDSYLNLMSMAERDEYDAAAKLILRSKAEHHQSVAWGIVKAAEAVGIDLLGIRKEIV